jgi:hypothetical protein
MRAQRRSGMADGRIRDGIGGAQIKPALRCASMPDRRDHSSTERRLGRIPILMTITKRDYGATSLLSGRIIRGPIRPAFCLDAPLRPAREKVECIGGRGFSFGVSDRWLTACWVTPIWASR